MRRVYRLVRVMGLDGVISGPEGMAVSGQSGPSGFLGYNVGDV